MNIKTNNQLFTNWKKSANNIKYCDRLSDMLNEIPFLTIDASDDPASIQSEIDVHMDTLKSNLIEAAKTSGIVPKHMNSPNKYWCPDLSRARDTKRFWWQHWNDNGRPRDGDVFRCYKNEKKLYRQLSRQCIYAKNNELYQSLDHLLKILRVSGNPLNDPRRAISMTKLIQTTLRSISPVSCKITMN